MAAPAQARPSDERTIEEKPQSIVTDTVRDVTLALLAARAPEATICPSEVARAIAQVSSTDWRDAMPAVHAAVDALLADGWVSLGWKGKPLAKRHGPYRIARGDSQTSTDLPDNQRPRSDGEHDSIDF